MQGVPVDRHSNRQVRPWTNYERGLAGWRPCWPVFAMFAYHLWPSVSASVPSAGIGANRWTSGITAGGIPAAPYQAVTVAYGGQVWMFGGSGAAVSGNNLMFAASHELWVFTPATTTWTNKTAQNVGTSGGTAWPTARSGHVGCVLTVSEGWSALFISGGVSNTVDSQGLDELLQDAWLYFFDNKTWCRQADMLKPLGSAMGTCLTDQVIIFGGMTNHDQSGVLSVDGKVIMSAETYIFEASSNAWVLATPMSKTTPSARWGGIMFSNGTHSYLHGGCITVIAGQSASQQWIPAENGTWSLSLEGSNVRWRLLDPYWSISSSILASVANIEANKVMVLGGFGKTRFNIDGVVCILRSSILIPCS